MEQWQSSGDSQRTTQLQSMLYDVASNDQESTRIVFVNEGQQMEESTYATRQDNQPRRAREPDMPATSPIKRSKKKAKKQSPKQQQQQSKPKTPQAKQSKPIPPIDVGRRPQTSAPSSSSPPIAGRSPSSSVSRSPKSKKYAHVKSKISTTEKVVPLAIAAAPVDTACLEEAKATTNADLNTLLKNKIFV